jgi:hypothetical protein
LKAREKTKKKNKNGHRSKRGTTRELRGERGEEGV